MPTKRVRTTTVPLTTPSIDALYAEPPLYRDDLLTQAPGQPKADVVLDKYLQAPRTVIPGTTMTYAGLKDDTKRADLIAYLATLK